MESKQVTISIAYYGTAHLIKRAVESVLNQTYQNIRVIVVNDGDKDSCWKPLEDIKDRRLFRYNLKQNRGPYYAHAISLAACESEFWSPHDSDDLSHPDRIERLVAAIGDADATFGTCRSIKLDGSASDSERSHWPGLYRTDYLKRLNLPTPNIRVSNDSLILEITQLFGRTKYDKNAVYEYHIRQGSLFMTDETGPRSAVRYLTWLRIRDLMNRFKSTKNISIDEIGQILKNECPDQIWDEIFTHSTELRTLISGQIGHTNAVD